MVSLKKHHAYHQPAAHHKIFNVLMAVVLVVTMIPVSALTYNNQASADTLSDTQASVLAANGDASGSLEDAANDENSLTGGVPRSLKTMISQVIGLTILP